MKKIIVFILLAFSISTSVYAYRIASNDGNRVDGWCDNGRGFAGSYMNDWWDINGPMGYFSTSSLSSSIIKACGE
jgi:hypothetical protein